MAKNRFNTRASWDNSFKYSGQLMPKAPKVSTPKKEMMSVGTLANLTSFYKDFNKKMNDWERDFVNNIINKGFKISPKQKETLKKIFIKVND